MVSERTGKWVFKEPISIDNICVHIGTYFTQNQFITVYRKKRLVDIYANINYQYTNIDKRTT